jgi:NAD(P)H-hydrate epimerase
MPDERSRIAASWAARWKAVIVLKGHGTIVTDGRRQAINATGNPGMATGGSGDVLTGVVTALVCQGFEVFEAAQLGAHVHGLAGDLAAEEMGQVGMIASDIVRSLPTAFLRHGQDADCATHP